MHRLLSALALCTALAPAARADDAATLNTLSVTYVSPTVEEWYGGFGTREFVFHDGRWQLIFTHAHDPAMTQRTFQFRTGGDYKITGFSTTVPGAFEVTFDENLEHVTLLTAIPEVIAGMGMAECGLQPNIESDISATGCAAWKPVAQCGDFDLLALDGTGLRFGRRPADNDMCSPEKRPSELLPVVVPR